MGLITKPEHALTPEPGEDQPAFAVRFHSVMQRRLPDTDGRNEAMLAAWAAHDTLAAKARKRWSPQRYSLEACVPLFDEHSTIDSDGTPVTYTCDDLAQMVRNMNSAISDTGNYPALTDGHTPEDPSGVQPEVLGYSGPFYLGQVGQDSPRYAIFSAEHHRRDRAEVLASHLCRSPEVWRTPRPQDRIMGPIAALGAEVPRRFNGMAKYARLADGTHVERYAGRHSMLRYQPETAPSGTVIHKYAATFASATSVALPSDRYSKDEAPMPAEQADATPTLSDVDIAKIVKSTLDALSSMPEMQFVQTLMSRGGDDGDDGDDGDGEQDEVLDSPTDLDDDEHAIESDNDVAPTDATPETLEPTAETDNSDGPLIARITALQAENAALKKQLADASGAKSEQYRRERIGGLREKGFQLDVTECLSLSADFSDEHFEKYARSLEKNALRVPLAGIVDVPKAVEPSRGAQPSQQAGDPRMEKYARQAAQRHSANRNAGRSSSYEAELQKVLAAASQQ